MDSKAFCTHTHTHLTKCLGQQILKGNVIPVYHYTTAKHLHITGGLYLQYVIKTTNHNKPGHGWDIMYRLITMVTMPQHGCVGSGPIANENRGFGVLLGRLLYTTALWWLFPTVLKAKH